MTDFPDDNIPSFEGILFEQSEKLDERQQFQETLLERIVQHEELTLEETEAVLPLLVVKFRKMENTIRTLNARLSKLENGHKISPGPVKPSLEL